MGKNSTKKNIIALIIIAVAILLCAGGHYLFIKNFNEEKHVVHGLASGVDTYMEIKFRGDSTSKWYKEDLDIYGATYDGNVYNKSEEHLKTWTLKINIQEDCYINQFWNGTVEIHQNVGKANEVTQTLDLADVDRKTLKLDYVKESADLLIKLSKGDYVIYHPSEKFKETDLDPGEDAGVGTIFYFKDDIDLSNYELEYYYHRDYTSGIGFIVMCFLGLVWIFVLGLGLSTKHIYKKAEKEMELRKSGISCMSEIYSVIYIIDLIRDDLVPVGVAEEHEKLRPKDMGAEAQLKNMFIYDAMEAYQEMMLKFGKLSTISRRLEKRDSIATEYESKYYGWNRIRFIAMERNEKGEVIKVLFTIQDINQEKKELENALGRVEKIELESRAKSTFLTGMSNEIREPINEMLEFNSMIKNETTEEKIRKYAEDVEEIGKLCNFIVNNILDYFKIESNEIKINVKKYSFGDLLREIKSTTELRLKDKDIKFSINNTKDLPDGLYGDVERMKQVIVNLIANALSNTERGFIKIDIFGKKVDDKRVHMLISVKNIEKDLVKEDSDEILAEKVEEYKNIDFEKEGIGINLTRSLLTMMDSELRVSTIAGNCNNYYFEVEQDIYNDEIMGEIE